MKRIEIKEVGIKSAFKTTLYMASIPLAIMMFVGVLDAIIGAAVGADGVLFMAIPYIIMPFFMILIYGLISMLMALIYNKLSSKFGGLELVIKDNNQIEDAAIISNEINS